MRVGIDITIRVASVMRDSWCCIDSVGWVRVVTKTRTCVVVRNIGRRRGRLDRDAVLGSVVVSSRRCDSTNGELIMCIAS